MGILDDAIREHLDLKRKHGARDAELREIEDEAFGSTDRPDPFSAGEVYGEVATATVENGGEEPTRVVAPEALRPQEPPSPPEPEILDEPVSPPEGLQQLPGQAELPGQDEIPGQERLGEDPESYQPSIEESYQPSTEESYQPSPEPESYRPTEPDPESPPTSESLEDLIAEEEPFPEDTAAPPSPPMALEPEPPPEEPLAEREHTEPSEPVEARTPVPEGGVREPPPPPPEPGSEPPGRARGRVDVSTQEHPPPSDTGDFSPTPGSEPELGRPDTSYQPPPMEEQPSTDEPPPDEEPPSASGGPQLYDFETDEDSLSVAEGHGATDDDFEALGPVEEEAPYLDEEEPYAEEPASGTESAAEPPYEEPGTAVRPAVEDEEAYEGAPLDPEERYEEEEQEEEEGEEDLWFEKGPPKDFDFDD
jgi:hypothetical protein